LKVTSIRNDRGGEFHNVSFEEFCDEQRISHNSLEHRTPQQNSVVERNNMSLEELARTMKMITQVPSLIPCQIHEVMWWV